MFDNHPFSLHNMPYHGDCVTQLGFWNENFEGKNNREIFVYKNNNNDENHWKKSTTKNKIPLFVCFTLVSLVFIFIFFHFMFFGCAIVVVVVVVIVAAAAVVVVVNNDISMGYVQYVCIVYISHWPTPFLETLNAMYYHT